MASVQLRKTNSECRGGANWEVQFQYYDAYDLDGIYLGRVREEGTTIGTSIWACMPDGLMDPKGWQVTTEEPLPAMLTVPQGFRVIAWQEAKEDQEVYLHGTCRSWEGLNSHAYGPHRVADTGRRWLKSRRGMTFPYLMGWLLVRSEDR